MPRQAVPSWWQKWKRWPTADVIFLQNHGVITYGPDIYEAFSRMDAVENTAKTILYSQILGDVREF